MTSPTRPGVTMPSANANSIERNMIELGAVRALPLHRITHLAMRVAVTEKAEGNARNYRCGPNLLLQVTAKQSGPGVTKAWLLRYVIDGKEPLASHPTAARVKTTFCI